MEEILWLFWFKYWGQTIQVGQKKRIYIYLLGIHQALYMKISLEQDNIWTKNLIWNHQIYVCTN